MATKEAKQAELTRIYERDGAVKASVVVKEAKPRKSPIHDEFEWDDATAAHEHRLATARRLIRVTPIRSKAGVEQRLVHVRPITIDGPTAATNESEGTYEPIPVVVQDHSKYERALLELYQQIRGLQRSVQELKAAAGHDVELMPQLTNALQIAKDTVQLMRVHAA